ncbi:MAG: hypothetical protein OIF50_03585 [Flavobacteriaceae bacterium]|nr:hypothetical protein [Flavobacteriaceae bacterium]
MRLAIFFVGLLAVTVSPPKLEKLRILWVAAAKNKTKAIELHEALQNITDKDAVVFRGYKGASLILKARYTRKKKLKKELIHSGIGELEQAITIAPNNIELRCVRLSLQENLPKFIKYRKNREEDKAFLTRHISKVKNPKLKRYIQGFVKQSKSFTEGEKALFLKA